MLVPLSASLHNWSSTRQQRLSYSCNCKRISEKQKVGTHLQTRLFYPEVNPSSSSSSSSASDSLRSQLREPVAPYSPVFLDGWKPEVLRPDGQVWEDPVESQHKNEDLRVKQEVRNTRICHNGGIYSTVGGGQRAAPICDSKRRTLVLNDNKPGGFFFLLLLMNETSSNHFFFFYHQLGLQLVHHHRFHFSVYS